MRVTVNGLDLACQADGPEDAPVLVLAHTLATSRAMWRRQIPHFADRYRVISFDMRGHGESAAPDYPYSLEMLAEDVIGVLDSLGVERPAIFLGISIGGMIGQALALRHADRFRAFILCSTVSRTPPEGSAMWDQRIEAIRKDGIESQVQPTLERWLSPEFRARDPETAKWVADMIRATPVAGMIGCARAIQQLDYTDQLERITVPTLIIAGEKDPGAPVAAAQVIHEGIKGSRLAVIPNVLHQAPIEATDLFNRIVDEFLERLGT
jgi:3-oxoadipate enol-lactonase